MPQNRPADRRFSKKQIRRITIGSVAAIAVVFVGVLAISMTGSENSSGSNATGLTPATEMQATQGTPQLVVDRTEIDYGDVAYGQQVSASYQLTNTGDGVLVIEEPTIKTLEGC